MNATDWRTIPGRLQAAGLSVCYERISYAPANPLWRATAQCEGRAWTALGRDLEAALLGLEEQTREAVAERHTALPLEWAQPAATESPVMIWQCGVN